MGYSRYKAQVPIATCVCVTIITLGLMTNSNVFGAEAYRDTINPLDQKRGGESASSTSTLSPPSPSMRITLPTMIGQDGSYILDRSESLAPVALILTGPALQELPIVENVNSHDSSREEFMGFAKRSAGSLVERYSLQEGDLNSLMAPAGEDSYLINAQMAQMREESARDPNAGFTFMHLRRTAYRALDDSILQRIAEPMDSNEPAEQNQTGIQSLGLSQLHALIEEMHQVRDTVRKMIHESLYREDKNRISR